MSIQQAETAFKRGDFALAGRLLAAHLSAHPRDAAAHYALGVVTSAARDWMAAVRSLRKACDLAGNKAPLEWSLALANAFLQAGDAKAALKETARLISTTRTNPDAWFCHALALQGTGRNADAAKAYEQCLAIRADHHAARSNLALLLSLLGFHASAAEHLENLVRAGQAQPWQHVMLANLLLALGQPQEARAILDKASMLAGDSPDYLHVHAQLCLTEGRIDDAREAFKACLARAPGLADAQMGLAQLDQAREERENQLDQLAQVLSQPLADWDRRVLLAARAMLLDKLQRPQEAFDAYQEAAKAGLAALKASNRTYDRKGEEAFAQELIRCMGAPFHIAPTNTVASDGLIFVVGMPRSGTTLIEQMLARHPTIYGAGELSDADSVLLRARREGYPDSPPETLAALAETLRQRYRAHLSRHGKPMLVDKMPANYWHVGMLAAAFPGARFIHVIRNPADTCLSCWQQTFAFAMQPWQHDFEDLAHAHALKDRLMAHWQTILPERILPVRYEEVVADPLAQSQRMATFLGIDWVEEMANPSGASGPVATASVLQVRQPIYTSSVGRLAKYGPGAQALVEALKRAGVDGV